MSDFQTEAELSIVIPDGELRQARQKVESSMGSVPVATDGGRATGGGGGRALRPRFVRQELSGQTDHLGELVSQSERGNMLAEELLEAIDGGGLKGGGGGDGGGPFGLLDDFIGDFTGDLLGDLVTEIPDTIGDILGPAIGTFIGELAGGGGGSVSVDKPDWVPLPVEEPAPVPVDVRVRAANSGVPRAAPSETTETVKTPFVKTEGSFDTTDGAGSALDDISEGAAIGATSGLGVGAAVGAGAGGAGAIPGAAIGTSGGALLGGTSGAVSWGIDAVKANRDTNNISRKNPEGRVTVKSTSTAGQGRGNGGTVNVYNDVDVGMERRDVRRIIEQRLNEFERDLERDFSSGR